MTRFGTAVMRTDERIPGVELPLMSVSQTRGVIRRSELTDKEPRADSLDVYKVCRQGDIVFNKMSVGAGAMGIAPEDGLVTYHYEVMRPRLGTDARYVVYLMKSAWFTGEMLARERGIGAGTSGGGVRTTEVPYSVLRTIDAPIPTPEAQRLIADFLDAKSSRLDEAVRLRREQVVAVSERMDSDWAFQAATLMAECSVAPLRRVLSSIVDGPFGSSLTSAHYSDEGTRVIRLGNLGRCAYRYGDEAFIPTAYGRQLSAHAVLPGDLLIAGLGDERWPLGRATIAPDDLGDAIVKADCYRARLLESQNAEFLAWFLSSPVAAEAFKLLSRGSTRARLNTAVVRDVRVPLASPTQQESTLRGFRSERRGTEAVLSEMTAQIALLEERRRSLITAAVTGEFDVTTASGRGI